MHDSMKEWNAWTHLWIQWTNKAGWWLSHPSEKYDFVSWDDEIPDRTRKHGNQTNNQIFRILGFFGAFHRWSYPKIDGFNGQSHLETGVIKKWGYPIWMLNEGNMPWLNGWWFGGTPMTQETSNCLEFTACEDHPRPQHPGGRSELRTLSILGQK